MADGKIIIETSVDSAGIKKGMDETQKTLKSQAASLAVEYKKQGMSASDAFKKAWSDIERDSATQSQKTGSNWKINLGNAFSGIGTVANKAFSGLGTIATTAMKGVATTIARASTAVVGLGTYAIKAGSEFESGMSQVAATMGITVDEIHNGSESFEMLKAAAKEAGRTTQFSATEASEALNYLALAGYDAEKAVAALPTTLNLAAAGGLDLGYASDLVTDSMSALGLSTNDLVGFVDQLSKTSQKSNTNIAQLGEAILTVGGTAKNLAGGTVELNTALGILADNGIKGAEGGTALRNVILSLAAPTNKSAAAMEKLGIDAFDANGNLRPLSETFEDFNRKLSSLSQEDQINALNDIFNKVDLKSVNALLAGAATNFDALSTSLELSGVSGENLNQVISGLSSGVYDTTEKAEFMNAMMKEFNLTEEQATIAFEGLNSVIAEGGNRFDQLSASIEDSTGSAKEQAKTLMDNLKGSLDIVSSSAESLGISIYENIDVPLKEVIQKATVYIGELEAALNSGGLLGFAKEIGSIFANATLKIAQAAPKMIETGVSIVQSFMLGIRDNLPSISSAAIEIGMTLVSGISSTTIELISIGSEIVQSLLTGISENAEEIAQSAIDILNTLVDAILTNLPLLLNAAVNLIGELVIGLAESMPQLVDSALGMIETIVDGLGDNLTLLVNAALQLITALAKGLAEALPELIAAVPGIIAAIVEAILNNLGAIIQAGMETAAAIGSGLLKAIPQLNNIIINICEEIVRVFKEADWGKIGLNILEGLKNGLLNGAGMVFDAIKNVANGILDKAKNALGIHSPSTVFAEMGKYICEGLEKGTVENAPDLSKVMTDAAEKAGYALDISFSQIPGKLMPGVNASFTEIAKNMTQSLKSGVIKNESDLINALSESAEKSGVAVDLSFAKLADNVKPHLDAVTEEINASNQKNIESYTQLGTEISNTKIPADALTAALQDQSTTATSAAEVNSNLGQIAAQTSTQYQGLNDSVASGRVLISDASVVFGGLIENLTAAGTPTVELTGLLSALSSGIYDSTDKATFMNQMMTDFNLTQSQASLAFDELSTAMNNNGLVMDSYTEAMNILSSNQDIVSGAIKNMGLSLSETDTYFQNLIYSLRDGATEFDFTKQLMDDLSLSSDQAKQIYDQLNTVVDRGTLSAADNAAAYSELKNQIGETVVAATTASESYTGLGGNLDTSALSASSASGTYSDLNSTIDASDSSTANATNAFNNLASSVSGSTDAMVKSSRTAVSDIGAEFSKLSTNVSPALTQLQGSINTWFSDLNFTAAKEITQFNKTVTDTITTMSNKIKGLLNQTKQAVSTWLTDLINLASTKIKQFSDTITNALTNMASKIKQILDNIKSNMQNWFAELVNMAAAQMKLFVNAVTNALTNMSAESKAILQKFSDSVSSAFDEIVNTVTQQMEAFAAVVSEGFSNAADRAIKHLEDLRSTAQSVFDQMADDAERSMRSLANTISDSLDGLADGFYNVGQDIVYGIGEGIMSKSGWLQGVIQDLIQDALTAAKEEAEIKSPSKRSAREVGKPFAQGIGVGFEAEAKNVYQRMASAVQVQTASFSARVSTGANVYTPKQPEPINKTNNNNPVLNFYQPIQSPSQVSRKVKQTMRDLCYGR